MKPAVVTLGALAATGVVWCVALLLERKPEAPPEAFLDTFHVAHVETKPGEPEPFPPGQLHTWEFHRDGTYLMRVLAATGEEMFRQEGVVKIDEPVEEMRTIIGGEEPVLARVHAMRLRVESQNRTAVADLPISEPERARLHREQRFEAVWTRDEFGPVLVLLNLDESYRLVARPAPPAPPPP
jgi:hypothetical protein